MNYAELIAKALQGRSVNQTAKDWGVPQQTLDRYVKAKTMPDFQTTLKIARDSGVDLETVVRIFAEAEAQKKPRGMFMEFSLANALSLVLALFLGLAAILPTKEALAQGFEKVPFRQEQ
ncbi:hypothetical protein [Noviherbaspirillum sp.]|uniref:hypothetical protein n=1 Tax=Noviherbaspirillum sp. TaxID=1926288 RepID=UPI002D58ED8E|nr:hypothetical protein [Noviherbaspirillum sp.]HZW23774.1 hypothetical protein [Noviherbaspirillum sp.]